MNNKWKWFHSFKFIDEEINGVIPYRTHEYHHKLLENVDFKDKTVLDIGCWDGHYCLHAAIREAKQVTGIDIGPWNNNEWQDKFDYVVEKSGFTNINRRTLSVYDYDGVFDITLFMGVLYHLKHPLLALERIKSRTREVMVLETHVSCLDIDYPVMKFYPTNELNNDPSNWWSPNIKCVMSMLETVGFKNNELIGSIPSGKDKRVTIVCRA